MLLLTTVNIFVLLLIEEEELPYQLTAKVTLNGVGLTTNDKLCFMQSDLECSYCEQDSFAVFCFYV